ncbi:MAG: diacylglycerol kinase [Nitrospinota bacterium]
MSKSIKLETRRFTKDYSPKDGTIISRIVLGMEGIQTAWKEEKSFRNQIIGFILMLGVLVISNPPVLWWCMAIIAFLFVISLELLNTAIESLIDFLHPKIHPEIKKIKDIAGAAVILSNLGILILGLTIIFKFWKF